MDTTLEISLAAELAAAKAALAAAEAERDLMRSVVDQLPAGILVAEAPSGRVIVSNVHAALLWPADNVLHPSTEQPAPTVPAFHSDGRPYQIDEWPVVECLRSGQPAHSDEVVVAGRDGRRGAVYVHAAPLRNAAGELIAAVTLFANVTPRKEAEAALLRSQAEIVALNADLERRVQERTEQLAAANRELEAFSYSISHDLRAPLRSVSGFAQIMLDDYAPDMPPEAQHYVVRMRDGAQRLGRLIDDLLAFSRLSRQPLVRQSVSPVAIVNQILAELEPEYAGRSLAIGVDETLPGCAADPGLLKQVYQNLLGNAVKFSRDAAEARIEVGCSLENGEQVYFVKDNGAGFDMQYADKLFGVFQRLHAASEFAGTGVGLAIVQRIILRHGGRVWADSTPGAGATFFFTLGSAELDAAA